MDVVSQWKPTVKTWFVSLYVPINAAGAFTSQTVTIPADINGHTYDWKWARYKNYFVYIANNFYNNLANWNLVYINSSLPMPGSPVCDYITTPGVLSVNFVQDILVNGNTTYCTNRTKQWKALTQGNLSGTTTFDIRALPGPVSSPSAVVILLEIEFSDSPSPPVYN